MKFIYCELVELAVSRQFPVWEVTILGELHAGPPVKGSTVLSDFAQLSAKAGSLSRAEVK
jgi:hypothetical protein